MKDLLDDGCYMRSFHRAGELSAMYHDL